MVFLITGLQARQLIARISDDSFSHLAIDLAKDGVVRWRRVDLARVIKTRSKVTLAERSVGAMLRRLGFRRLSVRPRHPQEDTPSFRKLRKTLTFFGALVGHGWASSCGKS
jgi:hypothetical protein